METGYYNFVYEPLSSGASPGFTGVFVLAIEVTGQVMARQQADQLLVRERTLNDLKSNFVTLASHEFRTPMGDHSLVGRPDWAVQRPGRGRQTRPARAAH